MSKKIVGLMFLLFFQMGLFVHPVIAVSCKDSQITWEPTIFSEGLTEHKLKFTIHNNNAFDHLKGRDAYLVIDQLVYTGGYPTTATTIPTNAASPIFEIVLPENGAVSRDIHWAKLLTSPAETSNYTETCSEISYQVGSVGKCRIDPDLQSSIPLPPNTLTINFVGQADKDYWLNWANWGLLGIPSFTSTVLMTTKTISDGQGTFYPVSIPGNNGDKGRLFVSTFAGAAFRNPGNDSCTKDITLDFNAPPQPTPIASPITPQAVGPIKSCPKKGEPFDAGKHLECVVGGGQEIHGCTDNLINPGIATAIGCIHTNPAELVKDLMTFVVGIGGGMAFLLMLLGAYQMLSSGGNPETLNAGRERLTNAVIGLLFVIFAVLLMQIIGVGILAIPGFK